MATDGGTDLPTGWPDAFDDEARDYLYEEGRQRLAESIEFGNQQEAKALALLRISLIIIAASGIFGDLQVDLDSSVAARLESDHAGFSTRHRVLRCRWGASPSGSFTHGHGTRARTWSGWRTGLAPRRST